MRTFDDTCERLGLDDLPGVLESFGKDPFVVVHAETDKGQMSVSCDAEGCNGANVLMRLK
jgi:hypothetical protein